MNLIERIEGAEAWQWIALYVIGACLTAFLHGLFRGPGHDEDALGFAVFWPFFVFCLVLGAVYVGPFLLLFWAIKRVGNLGSKGHEVTDTAALRAIGDTHDDT